MCGIIAVVSNNNVTQLIINGLQKLQYRGYDSAGIAVIKNNNLKLVKSVGKIADLMHKIDANNFDGNCGIGHTRWATHGVPSINNTHPFEIDGIALVHNGIIENHNDIRRKLLLKGYEFEGQTDSEVLLKLIHSYAVTGFDELQSVRKALQEVTGAYAIAVIFAKNSNLLICAKNGAPMVIGKGRDEMYVGSDSLAINSLTQEILYLQDEEIAIVTSKSFKLINFSGHDLSRNFKMIDVMYKVNDKQGYEHYMLKEIYEQPSVIIEILNKYYQKTDNEFYFDKLDLDFSKCSRVYIVACGTAFHAAVVAKYWFEKIAEIPVEVDLASEFRYRECTLDKTAISLFISQSGETADTLAALRHAKAIGLKTVSIINVVNSSIANESDYVLPVFAGSEIGVASTKAFSAQLAVLSLLTYYVAYKKDNISDFEIQDYLAQMNLLPKLIDQTIHLQDDIIEIAKILKDAKSMIYIGRNTSYALALEGALKMKELSYIHAEGIAAGELKHGSLALIDENMPVIVIAPSVEATFNKLISNVEEVNARKGLIISITDKNGSEQLKDIAKEVIIVPDGNQVTSVIISTVILQLLAYHVSKILGKDVDQPRNLAKSVTVE